jgi:AcrR family transcriptional regulator
MISADRRYRKTEASIDKALIDLLQNEGLNEITLPDLIQEADISKSTFYQHYKSFDSVVERLEDQTIALLYSFFKTGNPSDSGVWEGLTDSLFDNRKIWRAVYHAFSFRYFAKLRQTIYSAIKNERYPKRSTSNYPLLCTLNGFTGEVVGIVGEWVEGDCRVKKEDFAHRLREVAENSGFQDLVRQNKI